VSNTIIATPKSMENKKGGTWYTIKYAKLQNKKIILIKPNGIIEAY
jgi:hypothetical protein